MDAAAERVLRERVIELEAASGAAAMEEGSLRRQVSSLARTINGLREQVGTLAAERDRANAKIEELSDILRLDVVTEAENEELRESLSRAATLAIAVDEQREAWEGARFKAESRARDLEKLVGTLGRTLRTVSDTMGRAIGELTDDIPF